MSKTLSKHNIRKNRYKPSGTKSDSQKVKMSRQTVLLIFVATLSGHLSEVLAIYLSVILHELAHLAVCILIKVPVTHITVYPYGMKLQLAGLTSPREQMLISIAGPAVNLILFASGKSVGLVFTPAGILNFFTAANFMLFVFNMLPCTPLDGSEILRSFISSKWGIIYSYSAIIRISKVIVHIILICGCILAITGHNISLIIITAVLIKSVKHKRQEQLIAVKQIIYGEIISRYKPRIVCAKSDEKASTYIKRISFDYTLIILRSTLPPLTQKNLVDAARENPHIRIDDI